MFKKARNGPIAGHDGPAVIVLIDNLALAEIIDDFDSQDQANFNEGRGGNFSPEKTGNFRIFMEQAPNAMANQLLDTGISRSFDRILNCLGYVANVISWQTLLDRVL